MERVRSAARVFDACGLSAEKIVALARETGFTKRAGGKISAADFLAHFCVESVTDTVSSNDLASIIQAETGVSASRQAYWLRLDDNGLAFFQAVLAHAIRAKLTPEVWTLCPLYKRILIQDSTVIQLPPGLFACFSGVKNATTTTCNARIQGVYDLCAGRFISFSIDPYSRNDLSTAADIPVQAGDLVIRDRGYFLLNVMAGHKANGVDTISRYKHGNDLYDEQTQEKIDLLALLRIHGKLDRTVMAGKGKTLRFRLLAVPVPEEVANLRRMKAKKETKGHDPSAVVLALMSWSIFVLTIENPAITATHIMALYGLRWRIENIFKVWKSHFSFAKVHPISETHLRMLLTARLTMMCFCFHDAYVPLCRAVLSHANKQLSLIKFMRYVRRNLPHLPRLLIPSLRTGPILDAIARYCAYDRRKRRNYVDNMHAVFEDLSGKEHAIVP